MATLKTRPNAEGVAEFIDRVADPVRQRDARIVCELLKKIARREPRMWGSSIVGFGAYSYTYASGRSGEWPLTGFSPRKQALTLYVMSGFDEYEALLGKLGDHKIGKSCLYIRNLDKVDTKVLASLIRKSVAHLRRKWPTR